MNAPAAQGRGPTTPMAALHEDLAPAGGSPGPSSRFDHWIVVLAAVLAFVGLCLAGYLAFENLQAKTGVCTITHGCATVQQSRYGKPFGIPISVPGLALYLALFGLAVTWLKDARHLRAQATALAFFAAEAGFVVSVYLTYIEGWVLDAWCIYCITSACLMTALALLWLVVLIRTARRRSSEASQG